jgi:hypothetical protein
MQKVRKSWREAKGLALDRQKQNSFMKSLWSTQDQRTEDEENGRDEVEILRQNRE